MQKIIVIVGPTASGKTKLAVELARKFNGEIVSADSRQVYRGMDIGTGKDIKAYSSQASVYSSQKIQKKDAAKNMRPHVFCRKWIVPYHLIDIVSPRTNFTLAQYQKLAYRAIEDILRRGRVPILVGGTGLYVQAVVDGYVLPHATPDSKLRAHLAMISTKELGAKLKKLDPATYRVIDKHNRRRLERAIEICLATGVPLSDQRKKQAPPYEVLMLGLGPRYTNPRSRISVTGDSANIILYRRIDKRLKERLEQGMIAEVAGLHKQGVSWKRLESLGLEYKYVAQYLKGMQQTKHAKSYDRTIWRTIEKSKYNYDEMVHELSRAIKDFSRRQMTWFKRDKRIGWISKEHEAEQSVKNFLEKTNP